MFLLPPNQKDLLQVMFGALTALWRYVIHKTRLESGPEVMKNFHAQIN